MPEAVSRGTFVWTEQVMFELARILYQTDGATQDEVDEAVKQAIRHPGCTFPIGTTSRTVTLSPGVKERFGVVSGTI